MWSRDVVRAIDDKPDIVSLQAVEVACRQKSALEDEATFVINDAIHRFLGSWHGSAAHIVRVIIRGERHGVGNGVQVRRA